MFSTRHVDRLVRCVMSQVLQQGLKATRRRFQFCGD
jgi:hypothetical protein